MCEILDSNFEEKFPEIISVIQKAAFVAVDTEFTGLNVGSDDQNNLFDSAEERYSKLRSHANSFIICQIGLSAFVKVEDVNKYEAHTYNFYICPRSRGIFDSTFVWQVSGLEFLCKHGFDFNKFAYHGLPYLNGEDEKELRKKLKTSSLFGNVKRDVDDMEVKECCSKVANWLANGPGLDDEFVLHVSGCLADYVIHKEIRLKFIEAWTFHSRSKEVIVKKVSLDTRAELQNSATELDEKLVDHFVGFTKVFNCLITNKKPLVGHNLLTDLILMYNQFYKPLPKNYKTFKLEITSVFPKIYDTKHMSYTLSKIYKDMSALQSTVLFNLYSALNSHIGRFYVLYSPDIGHAEGFSRYVSEELLHEAGYDAYLSGYVFLRMAHLHSQQNKSVHEQQPVSFSKLLTAMEPFCCQVNLIRAHINYVNLRGVDPWTRRPKWLVIESKLETPLSVSEIMETCSRHGSVDVRLINPYKAMVAITTFPGAREIIKDFRSHPTLRVYSYDALRHSTLLKAFAWFCAAASSVAGFGCLILLHRRSFF